MPKYTVKHPRFAPASITTPIQWNMDPYGIKHWRHAFMSFRWVDKNIDCETAKSLFSDFIHYHITKKIYNPYYNTIAADHATAIRIEWLLEYRHSNIHLEDVTNLVDTILINDIKNMQNIKNYRFGHNHALIVDSALIKCYYSEEYKFKNIINIDKIIKRAIDTLHCIFSKDTGITKEHSISYQSFNFCCFKQFYDLISSRNDINKNIDISILKDFYNKVKDASKDILSLALRDTGTFFPAGDTLRPYHDDLGLLLDCKPEQSLQELIKIQKTRDFALFKEGFCFYRKRMSFFKKLLRRQSYIDLLFLCGWHSSIHKNNDDLSFILDYKGHCFFDDAGYSDTLDIKDTIALHDEHHHSTITIDTIHWENEINNTISNSINGFKKDDYCYMYGEHYRIGLKKVSREITILRNSIYVVDTIDNHLHKRSRHRFILGQNVTIAFAESEQDASKIILTKDTIAMNLFCIGGKATVTVNSISAVTAQGELENRTVLDYMVEPEGRADIRFFMTFDNTDWRRFCKKIAIARAGFPNSRQRFFLALVYPFIRLFSPLEFIIKFTCDPSDFCASAKKLPGRLLALFLTCLGPKPEKTAFSIHRVQEFLKKQRYPHR